MSSSPVDCNQDSVLPFHLVGSPVRGRVVRLSSTLDDLLGRHDYPERVNALVTEAVVLTALIGQLVNAGWKFSLQYHGEGAVRMIAADYLAPPVAGEPALLRAYAGLRPEIAELDGEGPLVGGGNAYMAILIDRGDGREPFKGMTPAIGNSLAAFAEEYFRRSEQIPTKLMIASGWTANGSGRTFRSGGIMIQEIPESPDAAGMDRPADCDPDGWARAMALMATLEAEELTGPEPSAGELVWRLFHEDRPMAAACQPLEFGCSCSEERVRRSLSIYSARDIARMTNADNMVTADCQFCGAHFELDPAGLGLDAASA